ncbi:tyrosine-protein kinase receptor-like [Frankliniella occidentalis]|uniref:Tyrosine-protein kinase receptor-like n=1 Tax=Frankliniella occidentalis TaxID=133901 RepID=A0A9C6U5I4_FRAOC|nr:tyrosine-protein kinase receptor-like [Frankliniella occidentalis]
MCGFTATRPPNQKSRMEWTRVNGSTPIHRRALDHTFLNASGMYLYAKSADEPMGSEALLDSAVFNPPPPCHRNATSRFKNSCEIRFFYHQFGPHSGSFAVTVYEFWPRNKKKSYQVFWNYGDKKSIWTQVLIILPHVKYKYQIHMEARRGLRASDLALDDFTLSPECFGLGIPKEELGDYNYATAGKVDEPVEHAEHRDFVNKTMYRFSTCGAKGMSGPSQDRCSSFYNGTNTNVTVLDAPFAGVQRWVVPETGPYT